MCPERHLEAAEILGTEQRPFFLLLYCVHLTTCAFVWVCELEGADVRNVKTEDAGRVLADILRNFLYDLEVEDGLSEIGYSKEDIPGLVKGTIPQVCSTISSICMPF